MKGDDYNGGAPKVNSAAAAPRSLLYVVHGLPPESKGGTEVATLRLAEEMAGRGHRVVVFAPRREGGARYHGLRWERRGGLDVAWCLLGPRPPRRFEDGFLDARAEALFGALLDTTPFDLCHVHHLTGLSMGLPALARARGIPVVMTLHDYWLPCGRGQLVDLDHRVCAGPSPEGCATCLGDQIALGGPRARLGRLLRAATGGVHRGPMGKVYGAAEAAALARPPCPADASAAARRHAHAREALAAADLVTAPSRDLLRRLAEMGWCPPGARTLDNLRPEARPRAPRRPPPPLDLVHVGALIPTKGAAVLAEAVRRLPPGSVRVRLIGPAPPFHRAPGWAEALVAGLPPGMIWDGPLDPAETRAAIHTAHALVLPSTWPENAPVVLREALASGVPVVTSALGGAPEVVEAGVNGLLVPPADPTALAEALASLLRPGALEALARGAAATPAEALGSSPEDWEALYQPLWGRRP